MQNKPLENFMYVPDLTKTLQFFFLFAQMSPVKWLKIHF